jgi:proteasome accessory factor A
MAETATALKLGTTGLVLQLIEEDRAPGGFDFDDPVETLKEISRDQDFTWVVALRSGRTISALDIQEAYLDAARKHCRGQDEETDWVLDQWESVLADLRAGYEKVVGRVDWASKLWLLESFREAEKLDWDDPMLKSLDLEYHNLHPGKGLYFGLVEEGRAPRVTTDRAVELARQHPPRNTRAFGRGELVRHLLEHGPPPAEEDTESQEGSRVLPGYVINWSIFQLRGQPPFPMPDPFKTYVEEVRRHLSLVR